MWTLCYSNPISYTDPLGLAMWKWNIGDMDEFMAGKRGLYTHKGGTIDRIHFMDGFSNFRRAYKDIKEGAKLLAYFLADIKEDIEILTKV